VEGAAAGRLTEDGRLVPASARCAAGSVAGWGEAMGRLAKQGKALLELAVSALSAGNAGTSGSDRAVGLIEASPGGWRDGLEDVYEAGSWSRARANEWSGGLEGESSSRMERGSVSGPCGV